MTSLMTPVRSGRSATPLLCGRYCGLLPPLHALGVNGGGQRVASSLTDQRVEPVHLIEPGQLVPIVASPGDLDAIKVDGPLCARQRTT